MIELISRKAFRRPQCKHGTSLEQARGADAGRQLVAQAWDSLVSGDLEHSQLSVRICCAFVERKTYAAILLATQANRGSIYLKHMSAMSLVFKIAELELHVSDATCMNEGCCYFCHAAST